MGYTVFGMMAVDVLNGNGAYTIARVSKYGRIAI
jgi:hypothetical protein